ncbi:MAG: prolyl oligopeptidase family serine peptidase [Melioribacteraceae bacterium]|nr:prolyl oligopeptidase family serine peptidase [Melioribacteraceae bacterium]
MNALPKTLVKCLFALVCTILLLPNTFFGQEKIPTESNKEGVGKMLPDSATLKKHGLTEEIFTIYESHEFNGMSYRLMKPIDYDAEKTYPLILSLHGAGGKGSNNIRNIRRWNGILADKELRLRHPCFVLVPQTTIAWRDPAKAPPLPTDEDIANMPKHWQKAIEKLKAKSKSDFEMKGDMPIVLEIIETLKKEFKIDSDRIYVLGHSMGGFGSWMAIWENPELFAAAIPSSGGLPPWYDYARIKDVPIWAFHGEDDPVVPAVMSRDIFKAMKKMDGNMKYTELPDIGHAAPGFRYTGDDESKGHITQYASDRCDITPEVWDWLFKQNLSDKMPKP